MEPLESYRPAEGAEEDTDETEAPGEVEIAETPEKHREQAVREHQLLVDMRVRYRVRVREPLALISQISRSGGTLLSQLFDGHPQCHAHPDELMIGYPRRRHWPQLDLQESPERWFEMLAEPTGSKKIVVKGYIKVSRIQRSSDEKPEPLPFVFSPRLQQRIFAACLEEWEIGRPRDVLDAYMTSYFNAWLDNHNLYTGPKKLVTGFTPRLGQERGSLAGFFRDYPDGRLITLVREPRSWYVSARRHNRDRYGKLERAIELWRESADTAIRASEKWPSQVFVLRYEDLVQDTEAVMGRLAGSLEIDFVPSLLEPTFNGIPIMADSSFRVEQHGVIRDPLSRAQELTSEESAQIEQLTGETYERVLALVR